MTFTKLFSSITESTVWGEDAPTRIAWITLLAMSDKHGRIWASVPGLANRARITVPEVLAALNKFMSPDPFSRTKDHEGRRIEEIDGGWRLLNHNKYRSMRDEEERKTYKAEWIRQKRASVDKSRQSGPPYTHTDTEAYTYTYTDTEIPDGLNRDAWSDYVAHRADLKAKPLTERGAGMAMRKLAKLPPADQQKTVDLSIQNGWTGLFPEKHDAKIQRNESFDTIHARTRTNAGLD